MHGSEKIMHKKKLFTLVLSILCMFCFGETEKILDEPIHNKEILLKIDTLIFQVDSLKEINNQKDRIISKLSTAINNNIDKVENHQDFLEDLLYIEKQDAYYGNIIKEMKLLYNNYDDNSDAFLASLNIIFGWGIGVLALMLTTAGIYLTITGTNFKKSQDEVKKTHLLASKSQEDIDVLQIKINESIKDYEILKKQNSDLTIQNSSLAEFAESQNFTYITQLQKIKKIIEHLKNSETEEAEAIIDEEIIEKTPDDPSKSIIKDGMDIENEILEIEVSPETTEEVVSDDSDENNNNPDTGGNNG
jgi:hypothetical protein